VPRSRQMIVCVHEMGHAVMASHFGWDVLEVAVIDHDGRWEGFTEVRTVGGLARREYARQSCHFALAGPMAQILYTGSRRYSERRLVNVMMSSILGDGSDWRNYQQYRDPAGYNEDDRLVLAEFIGERMPQIVDYAEVLRRQDDGVLDEIELAELW